MNKIFLDQLKGFSLLLFGVSLLLFGCSQKSMLQSQGQGTAIPFPKPTPSLSANSVDSSCEWPPTQIANVEVSSFNWSVDGSELIYKDINGKWYVYTVSHSETREYIGDSETIEKPDVFGIQTYEDFFISPDNKSVVFTITSQDGYSIYLKNLDGEAPVYLGDIKGLVDEYEWLHDGNSLILSIDWASKLGATEAYVYRVDILEKRIKVVIPHSSDHVNITYLGVVPDDSKLLYVTYSGKDRHLILWDMANNSSTITEINAPQTYRWLPNGQEFVAVGYQNDGTLKMRIFTYDIETGFVRYMSPFQVNAHPNIKDAIQISPNLDTIGFIDEDHRNLFLIDCREIVQ